MSSPSRGASAASARTAGEVGALRRREHLGDIGDRVGDALGRGLGELHLVGAQRFELGAVDRRRRERVDQLLARLEMLGAQLEDVVGGLLRDRVDLLLLLARGIDRPAEPLDAALDPAGEEHAVAEAAHLMVRRTPAVMHRRAVPALAAHRAGDDGADHAAGDQQRGGEQETAQPARFRGGLGGSGREGRKGRWCSWGAPAWRCVTPYVGAARFPPDCRQCKVL